MANHLSSRHRRVRRMRDVRQDSKRSAAAKRSTMDRRAQRRFKMEAIQNA